MINKYRGIDKRNPKKKKMVYGSYHKHLPFTPNPIGGVVLDSDYKHLIIQDAFSDWNMPRGMQSIEVIPESVKRFSGLEDKNKRELYDDDLVKLILPNGEIRIFRLRFKTVDREIKNHPEFVGEYSKVRVTAIVFEWNGFDLFPCIDEKGRSDVEKMEWAGTYDDNPELLEESK